jgi:hypothetical protein
MRKEILRKSILVLIILTPLFSDLGCKKQPKCGCGKDELYKITEGPAYVYYIESSKTAYFYSVNTSGSTYYFCNSADWIDTLKNYTSGQKLLVSGSVYYECNYLMNSGSSGYYQPPVYQVIVTAIKEDNYGKK